MRTAGILLPLMTLLSSCHRSSSSDAEHHHEVNAPPAGTAVTVSLGGKSMSVDLRTVAGDGGADAIPFSQVVTAAFPAEDPGQLRYDLVGSDGFRPTSRPKCPHLLTGEDVAHLGLKVATHDVTADDKSMLPGCYHVKAVVSIEATK
jgi:hypothetical protein